MLWGTGNVKSGPLLIFSSSDLPLLLFFLPYIQQSEPRYLHELSTWYICLIYVYIYMIYVPEHMWPQYGTRQLRGKRNLWGLPSQGQGLSFYRQTKGRSSLRKLYFRYIHPKHSHFKLIHTASTKIWSSYCMVFVWCYCIHQWW